MEFQLSAHEHHFSYVTVAKRLNTAVLEQETRELLDKREPRQNTRQENQFVKVPQGPKTGGKGKLRNVVMQSKLSKRHALKALRKHD